MIVAEAVEVMAPEAVSGKEALVQHLLEPIHQEGPLISPKPQGGRQSSDA